MGLTVDKHTPNSAHVNINLPKGRATVSGAAIAVILIVALIGMTYVSVRAIELGQQAIEQSAAERANDL